MTSLFERELERMEQEVRDLKTIHLRGIDSTRFYESDVEKSFNIYADVTVVIAGGEPMPGIVTMAANIPTPLRFPMIVYTPQEQGFLFDVLGSGSGTMKAKVLSSSQIGSVS